MQEKIQLEDVTGRCFEDAADSSTQLVRGKELSFVWGEREALKSDVQLRDAKMFHFGKG